MCTSEFCSFSPGLELVDYSWQAMARYVNPSILQQEAFGSKDALLSGILGKQSVLCHSILAEGTHQGDEKAITLPKLHSSNFLKLVTQAKTESCLDKDLEEVALW
jgi:hypothetical protein